MSALNAGWRRADLVPLEQRLAYLQRYRVAAVVGTLLVGIILRGGGAGLVPTAVVGGGGIAIGFVSSVLVRYDRGWGRWLFGVTLLMDGVLLTTLSHLAGGLGSPVRYLVVLHLVVVTLIASHRTGVKLAIWHSLLALVVHEAAQVGWVAEPNIGDPTAALAVNLALLWIVTFVTASASAVNEREILRRRYDLDALAAMSAELERTTDVHTVAGVLVDHVVDTFEGLRAGVVSLRDDDPLTLAAHGLAPVSTSSGVSGVLALVRDGRSTLLLRRLDDTQDAWLASQMPDARGLVCVPLVADDTVDDVLVLELGARPDGRLERRIVATVERFAAQGALALSNARLHAELVAMSQTDGLTGVANRAAFDRALQAEIARVERTGSTFSLVLCDLDRFKDVNDVHGHLAGDAALVEVAARLSEVSRPYDVVARFGGEEFAVLMPSAGPDAAQSAAERLRVSISTAGTEVPLTVSVGVVSVSATCDAAAVIGAADAALYRAKREGRDCVRVAEPITRTRGAGR